MFQTLSRKRLLAATVFVFCVLAAALKFGSASRAGNFPFTPLPLMTVTTVDTVVTNPLSIYSSRKIGRDVVGEMAGGGRSSVVIFLTEQADVGAAYEMKDEDARGWFVYNTLTEHATRTQADLKTFLTARGVEYQSFWAANMIVAMVDLQLAEQIASRNDVARIDSNRPSRWIEDPAIADRHVETESPEATEWGVNNVNAPSVWAMGFTGQGIVIGNQDTGMRWTHSAIKPKYRGWNGATADHNFNWHDAIHSGGGVCGANATAPCDDHGHGTHTTGTTVGDDGAGNQIGVAPGAKWIGCRDMDQGNGTPATYTECFQFFIAPTDLSGMFANPTLRPHVMNNSWGCPVSEGCTTGAELETIVNNTQAAGIFVEVSAGNAGPDCNTVEDAPAFYNASFSTGSINISNSVSGFSSRGPSTFYNPNILKPNISAPGSNVRSSYDNSDTDYVNLSGTSMAGPHVCGVVALLWSARPQLVRDIAATKALLQNTANPNVTVSTGTQTCGGTPSTQIPNNSFGYGRVDALAAVNAAGPTTTATNTATATNTPTRTPTNTSTATATATATPSNLRSRADFDGDGKSDLSVFRPSESNWYINRSSAGFFGIHFGLIGDIPIPGDYDGDGRTDLAVFRPDPDDQTPTYFVLNSSTNTLSYEYWGVQTDLPQSGDYDGDGKTDMSVYRTSNNTFYIKQSSGGTQALNFGAFGDIPMFLDYEGDGKSNIAVFRPGTGTWYIAKPTGVPAQNFYAIQFGVFGDMPVPADYDHDNKDDVAVFRPSDGNWYLLRSSDGGFGAKHFGLSGDVPVPGDYDGDGEDDVAVYRNGIWYLDQSTAGFGAYNYGLLSDMPIPRQYLP